MASLSPQAEAALRQAVGRVYLDASARVAYAYDASPEKGAPWGVALPAHREEVAALVRWALKYGVPLVPRGAGTGLAGGAVAHRGGLVVALTRMRKVHRVHVPGRFAEVDAGVPNLELDREVARAGLFYPPDPSSQRVALIGGNLATNAGGPRCFKYGVTASYLLGLEGVAGTGEVVRFGGPVYDAPDLPLADLWLGSEGTLGIITRAWLRLLPRPPAARTLRAAFPRLEDVGRAVSAVVAAGLVPVALEVMDRQMVRIVEAAYHLGLPTQAGVLLLVEVDGAPEALEPQMQAILPLLKRHGGYDFRLARTDEERAALWKARKSAAGAFARLAPGFYLADVSVPRTQMAAMFAVMDRLTREEHLTVAYLAHAGDGNLHARIPVADPDDPQLWERVYRVSRAWLKAVLQAGGTITGEHGVGLEKRDPLTWMYGGNELQAMAQVKRVFDPQGILNPGKVLPEDLPPARPAEAGTLTSLPVLRPRRGHQAARWLRACGEQGLRVRIVEKAQGRAAPSSFLLLETAALAGPVETALEDLYLTVPAGVPLAQVHQALEGTSFFLPLTSPWPEATVGALLSLNLNPPSRTRYGGWRDHVLALEAVLADGRVLQVGRPVVKDVAGYALARAFIGMRGALGLVTRVTLKLHPRPRAVHHRLWEVPQPAWEALAQARRLAPRLRLASAWLLFPRPDGEGVRVAYTGEGWPQDVEAELQWVRDRAAGLGWSDAGAGGRGGTALWSATLRRAGPWLLRVGLPLDRMEDALYAIRAWLREDWALDMLHGLLYVTVPPGEEGGRALSRLHRTLRDLGGYVYPLRVPLHAAEAAAQIWSGAATRWWDALRAFWDPEGVLVPPWQRAHWVV